MKNSILIFFGFLIFLGVARYIINVRQENLVTKQRLQEERERVQFLKKQVAQDERVLDQKQMRETNRVANIEQLLAAKQRDVSALEERMKALANHPDPTKAKQDAESDVKIQKDRVDQVTAKIMLLEQSKKNRGFESEDDRHAIEDRFRSQEQSMGLQLKSAEGTLHALESELKQIKVIRKDPVTIRERESKAQEISNQKVYVSDLKRQMRELATQHSEQKNQVSSGLLADQHEYDRELAEQKVVLKDERARYDAFVSALKSFNNSEQGIKEQMRVLSERRDVLMKEMTELKASK